MEMPCAGSQRGLCQDIFSCCNKSVSNLSSEPEIAPSKRSKSPNKKPSKGSPSSPSSSPARRRKSTAVAKDAVSSNVVLSGPSSVVVLAVHPGCVRTEITKNMNYYMQIGNYLASPIMSMIQKSREQGAYSTLHALLAPTLTTEDVNSDSFTYGVIGGGVYFQGAPLRYVHSMAHDEELAKRVWQVSEEITDLPRRFAEVDAVRRKLK